MSMFTSPSKRIILVVVRYKEMMNSILHGSTIYKFSFDMFLFVFVVMLFFTANIKLEFSIESRITFRITSR